MFENLIAQDEIAKTIKSDIVRKELPPSLLFSGPENAGKLTAALETARILSCDLGKADWNCPCPSCERHRLLSHPDLLILGPRSQRAEILAAGELLGRSPNRAARYLFFRAVRKLTLRFNPLLFDGEESRLSKAAPLLQSLDELAEAAGPDRENPEEAAEAAAKALPLADKLEALQSESLPVFQVRAAERWARLAPFGAGKVVIVDNAERMLDGARNALLKILEEAPKTTRFILLSPRPAALIPTIQSRVRSYAFLPRDASASREILAKVFRAAPEEAGLSLTAFLAARRPFSTEETDSLARRFLSALCAQLEAEERILPPVLHGFAEQAQDRLVSEALGALSSATKGFGSGDEALAYVFPAFLRSLSALIRDSLRIGDADVVDLLSEWSRSIRDTLQRYDAFNVSAPALSERLAELLSEPLRRRV